MSQGLWVCAGAIHDALVHLVDCLRSSSRSTVASAEIQLTSVLQALCKGCLLCSHSPSPLIEEDPEVREQPQQDQLSSRQHNQFDILCRGDIVHDHTVYSYLNGFCRNILILLNHCRNSPEIHTIGILLKCTGFRGEQFTFCIISHCYCSMLRDAQDFEARKVTVDTDGLLGLDVL
jgi:hypothetical protein